MAISRYYGAKPQEYVSQFVPENLALMQNALNQRQQSADKTADEMGLYEDALLNEKALKKYDTEQLENIRSELEDFTSSMSKKDLSLPQNAREVSAYMKKLNNDPRLQKIRQGLASKDKYDKIIEEYKKDGKGLKYAYENDEFIRSFTDYMNQEGDDKKFAIDFIGGKETIQAGVDMYADKEKHFKNISASGRETLDKISDGDITRYFKEGATGKSYDKILEVANSEFDDYQRSPGGQQMLRWIDTYKPDLKTNEEKSLYMFKDFLETGKKQVGMKYTTNKDVALNQLAKERETKQAEKAYALTQKGKTQGYFGEYNNIDDFNSKIRSLKNSKNPADIKQAEYMEAQKEYMQGEFAKTLTGKDKLMAEVTSDQIIKMPQVLPQLLKELSIAAQTRAEEYTHFGNPKNATPFRMLAEYDVDNASPELQKRMMETYKKHFDIEKYAKKAYAKLIDVDIDDYNEKRDSYITKGEIFESTDIILGASSGSNSTRTNVANQLQTSLNNINYNILQGDAEMDLSTIAPNINKESIHLTRGVNGMELAFTYKDVDGIDQTTIVQPKGMGEYYQATTDDLYRNLSGGDDELYKELRDIHITASLKPVTKNSTLSQKEDVINKALELTSINTGNELIVNKISDKLNNKYKNYSNINIIRSENGVELVGTKWDVDGNTASIVLSKGEDVPELLYDIINKKY